MSVFYGLYLSFNKAYGLSAHYHIRNVSCIEINTKAAVVIRHTAGIDKLCHPRVFFFGHDKRLYEGEILAVIGAKKHYGGMAFAVFKEYAVLKTNIAIGKLIDLNAA